MEVQTDELKGRSQSGQELSVSSSEPPHLFWSLVGVFPAGEAERPNHDIAAAQTQQEVEEEVVSVPVTHLRQTQRLCLCRLTARPCGNVLQDACFSLWWPPHSVPTVLHCVDAVLWVVAASSSRFTSSDHRTFQSAGLRPQQCG